MTFVRSIPKSFTAKQRRMAIDGELLPRKKPDFSNFVKSTEDALNGILWEDDNVIVQGRRRDPQFSSVVKLAKGLDLSLNKFVEE